MKNKNTFIKIMSFLIILSVLLGTFGCSKGKDSSGGKDAGVVDFGDMKEENGTVIYTHSYTDKETGEKKEYTEVVDVDKVNIPQVIAKDEKISQTIKDSFINSDKKEDGMTDDDIKDITDKPENWRTFYIVKYIENKSDKQLACSFIKAENNGENGIWVKSELGAEYSIGPGNAMNIEIYGIADMSKYDSDEAFEEAFKKLKIKLQYTFIDSSESDIDDWSSVTTYAMNING